MNDRWAPWRFLIGTWVAVVSGRPGEGDAGGATFALELGDNVLTRRSYAHFPATPERPAFTHEDLLYVYPDGDDWRAMYFDNEGHVLRYHADSDGRHARFETEPDAQGMRYRLAYEPNDERLRVSFAIAPSDGTFTEHVGGLMERKA